MTNNTNLQAAAVPELAASRFKQACWLYTQDGISRYLLCNAEGRWDGAEKAQRHAELCDFYVAVVRGVELSQVPGHWGADAAAVRAKTRELTDRLDEAIGFPLQGTPDYECLAPRFFEQFHALALAALALR